MSSGINEANRYPVEAAPPPSPAEREFPDAPGVWLREGQPWLVYERCRELVAAAIKTDVRELLGPVNTIRFQLPRGHWTQAAADPAAKLAWQQVFNMFDPPVLGTPGLKVAISGLRERVSELEAEVERLRAERQWQPIETAPKESRSILVWCPQYLNIYCVYWTEGRWKHFGGGADLCDRPTHWQPLPQPPNGQDVT